MPNRDERKSRKTVPARPSRAVSKADISLLLELPVIALLAWLVPQRSWPALARGRTAATRPLAAEQYRSLAASIRNALGEHPLAETPEEIARALFATGYETKLHVMRHYMPGAYAPTIRLHGREHLDDAAAEGRGAILWVADLASRTTSVKVAFHRVGHPLTFLSGPRHGFSPTRFGMRFLNPIRTAVDDRYFAETAIMSDKALPTERRVLGAMRILRHRLDEGKIVAITANANRWAPVTVPIFDGTTKLARGAPGLAYETGAPLLAVFAIRDEAGAFDVMIEPPLDIDRALARRQAADDAVHCYARRLEDYVVRYPGQWEGWFHV